MEEHDPQPYAIIGAAMFTHRELGHGYLESVYHRALAKVLAMRRIPFAQQVPLQVIFLGEDLGAPFKVDFLCYGDVLVEIRASSGLVDSDRLQVVNYLKASGKSVGLLLNFGADRLEYERFRFWHGQDNPSVSSESSVT